MKPCTTCKHRVKKLVNLLSVEFLECKHPTIPSNPVSGTNGTMYCSAQRRPGRKCGPEGKYHETK